MGHGAGQPHWGQERGHAAREAEKDSNPQFNPCTSRSPVQVTWKPFQNIQREPKVTFAHRAKISFPMATKTQESLFLTGCHLWEGRGCTLNNWAFTKMDCLEVKEIVLTRGDLDTVYWQIKFFLPHLTLSSLSQPSILCSRGSRRFHQWSETRKLLFLHM